ncbi:hypothetical protein F4782DRAFT_487598 [Xylaria castorea]|nr:hypothetical protein F4782DRAFT_487598 [Xylaria castorea]
MHWNMRPVTTLSFFEHVLPSGFKLPSRFSLTKYVTSYFEGFHLYMSFRELY